MVLGPTNLFLAMLIGLGSVDCAHHRATSAKESLRLATETFHRLVRWGDFRYSCQLVVAQKREGCFQKVSDQEKNLKITNYELLDIRWKPEKNKKAQIISSLTWHRLPKITTCTENVVMEWEEIEGVWFIVSINGGPSFF